MHRNFLFLLKSIAKLPLISVVKKRRPLGIAVLH